MTILFDPVGSPANPQEMILRASSISGVDGLMILACDANGFTPENIDEVLNLAPVPVFGGVFPALIFGKDLIRQGSLVAGLPKVLETLFFNEEIESVHHGNRPLVGACTIGEIANCGTEYLEFYDKTAVVAVLETRK